MHTLISNATLVLPEQLIEGGWLLIEDGRIAALGEGATCPSNVARSIDAASCFLLPGLIDLHCDAIEKLVEPRPNVFFDTHIALAEADWRLAGCGITTEFHAVSVDDNESGVRSDRFVRELAQTLREQANGLLMRHKIHARLELSSSQALDLVAELIAAKELGMVSLMDHSPGQGQFTTEQAYREYLLQTTNRSDAEIDAIFALKRDQVGKIPSHIESVTRLARAADLAIATHDDDTVKKVEQWPALGVTLSEFPTTMAAARRAHELGLAVCMGAPNVLRGTSSGGNLSALEGIRAGVVDVLCADYYPAAMLAAVFKLARQEVMTLAQATRLVTLNAARAIGLGDEFGSLVPGRVADLIVVSLGQWGLPLVQRVFVGGVVRVGRATAF